MSNLKACFYALMLFALVSCKKELSSNNDDSVNPANTAPASTANIQSSPQTLFGLLVEQGTVSSVEQQMKDAKINMVRVSTILSKTTVNQVMNQYINDGYNVEVNLNWGICTFGPIAFPQNTALIQKQAEAFFKYYQPYQSHIPVVVVENEWDNANYHRGTIQDYLNELAIITDVGHKYGFKIADAGLSSTGIRRWMYSQLTGDAANQWRSNYYVGLNINHYDLLLSTINTYTQGVKNIPIDFLNVHWYNIDGCYNGFQLATQTYLKAAGKTMLISNEFGIRTNSPDLFNKTVDEIKDKVYYAIAYSGLGQSGKAATLTNDMLKAL